MTPMPHIDDAPPLLTDDDVLDRVTALVGPALTARQLWLLFLDGDRRQAPMVVPIEDLPERPEDLENLGFVVQGVMPALATDAGAGAVVFVLERRGPDVATATDEAWADHLGAMSADVTVDGVYLSAPGGVRRLRGMWR